MKTFTILDLRTVMSNKKASVLVQTLRGAFPNLPEVKVTIPGKNMHGNHMKTTYVTSFTATDCIKLLETRIKQSLPHLAHYNKQRYEYIKAIKKLIKGTTDANNT